MFRVFACAAAGMACLIALLPAAGHDQMWCLYAARLVRHGAKLYGPQLFESNPPLIVWLSLAPSALADWLHLPDTAVGKLLVVGLGAAVARVSLGMLRRLRPKLSQTEVWALAFVFIAVFGVMPARDFGQRDHILVLLCLPYVLAAALDAEGQPLSRWEGVLAGLAAGLGIALKPHQALVAVAVEIGVLTLRRGREHSIRGGIALRPEALAILGCGGAYLFAMHHFAPAYLSQVVPVLRDTYWAFGHLTLPQLIGQAIQLHILAAVALIAFVEARPARRAPVVLLLVAGVAATLAYYLQGTGWYYQQLPALSFFSLALALLAIDATEKRPVAMPRWALRAAAVLSVLALALTAHFTGYPFTPERSFPIDTPDPSFFAGLAPGTPVATLTTTVDDTVPPVFKHRLTLAQRSPHLWMLPAILRNEDPQAGTPHSAESRARHIPAQRLAQLDALQHGAMVEDFQRWEPQLVLVERCQDPAVHCQVLEDRHDDLLGWFLRDPRFREVFAHYRFLRSAGPFDGYVLK